MTAFAWAAAPAGTEPPPEVYCATRDVAQARVQTLYALLEKSRVPADGAALLAAIAGELVSNCFDHNLGAWHDISGCWFEHHLAAASARILVADRGQGFLGSLRRVRPDLADHRSALLAGFTARVSGRAPEPRGRGLTFVLESLARLGGTDVEFQTGDARLTFTSPVSPETLAPHVKAAKRAIPGTYAKLTWRRRDGSLSVP